MNSFKKYEIECPQCSERQGVEICQSIDAQTNPELREDLLSNRMNVCDCERCEYRFRIDAPIFYRDAERGHSIFCMPRSLDDFIADDRTAEEEMLELQSSLPADRKAEPIQLVRSHSELIERIFMIEERMDARIVEYIKYLMHTRNPDKLDPSKKRLLYNAQQSTPEKLLFIVQDLESHALEGILEYDRNAYDMFVELFDQDEMTPDLIELFPGPFIDARACLLAEIGNPS